MRKAAVIGGGAAGMMTAVLAAGEKTEIHLYEKNEKLKEAVYHRKGPLQCDKRLPDRRVLHECGDKPEISVQLRLQL